MQSLSWIWINQFSIIFECFWFWFHFCSFQKKKGIQKKCIQEPRKSQIFFYKKNLIQSCHCRRVVWIKSSFLPSPKRMAGDPSGKFGSQAGGGPLLLQRGAHWLGASLESSSPGAERWWQVFNACHVEIMVCWHDISCIVFSFGGIWIYIYIYTLFLYYNTCL